MALHGTPSLIHSTYQRWYTHPTWVRTPQAVQLQARGFVIPVDIDQNANGYDFAFEQLVNRTSKFTLMLRTGDVEPELRLKNSMSTWGQ